MLYDALTEAGHNVTLVAPKEQQSVTGTDVDINAVFQPTEVVKFEENKWYVDAGVRITTWAGLDLILSEKPDLVISGINEGENIGVGGAVFSGTVSSAVTSLLRDVPAIAVSAGIDLTDPERTATSEAYEVGADFITNLIAQLQATQGEETTILPARTGLSVNVPLEAELERVKFTEPDSIEPFIIDFGELPQGGAGLRFALFALSSDTVIDPLSEGGQFLSGFITVTAIDGNWTAGDRGIADITARLADLISEPVSESEPTFGSLEADVLEISGSNQLIFAGEEDDLIDASFTEGNNRIYGGSGDDTFILGTGDRAIGAAGEDRFFATSGGDNTITGGEGEDQFWIANAEIPESANIITDFTSGEDVIRIVLGIGFADLSLTQDGDNTLISFDGNDLAVLLGVDSTGLSEDNFVFV